MSAKELNSFTGEQQIKRLLRHRHSQAYFTDGGWTNDPAQAESFADIVQAAQTCADYGLSDVELALCFEPGADVFCTPLR
jgi:hypothetical protein